MQGNAPLSVITGVPGWESIAEQWYLLSLAREVPDDTRIVEIGAEYGMSASIFIKGTNETRRIQSIDLFPHTLLQDHISNLREAGMAGMSSQIKADSSELGCTWQAQRRDIVIPIMLLFIDGDHSYAGVKRDIESWMPLLASGGKVAFHDCACSTNANPHPLHFEVSQAIDEWAVVARWEELPSVDSIRTFVKP